MVISTGMTLPRMASVWALYALQKSMMLTPWGPRAVPTGGAGVAAPAWSCTLTSAAIFFLGGIPLSLSRGQDEGRCPLPLVLLARRCLSSHRVFRRVTRPLASLRDCVDTPLPFRPYGSSHARIRASNLLDLGEAQ